MQSGFQPSAFQNTAFQILISIPIIPGAICSLNTAAQIGSIDVTVRLGAIAVTVENGSLNIMIRCS